MALFHYTSTEALLGILRTGSIRLTDLRFVNDSTELLRFLNTLRTECHKVPLPEPSPSVTLLESKPSDQETIMRFRQEFLDWLVSYVDEFGFMGVACFSRAPNDLSQWRAYTPHGTAVAIEFSRTVLEEWASEDGHKLLDCVYSQDPITELAKSWVERIDTYRNWETSQVAAAFYFDELLRDAALYKDSAFHAEAEVRLLSDRKATSPARWIDRQATRMFKPCWDAQNRKPLDLEFRVGKYTAVPFTSFDIKRHSESGSNPHLDRRFQRDHIHWAIESITIGPTREPDLAKRAILMAASLFGFHAEGKVQYCNIPFRQL